MPDLASSSTRTTAGSGVGAARQALADVADDLLLEVGSGVAVLTLARPQVRNAVSYAMWHALGRVVPALDAAPEVDVVVLRGTPGGPFSAGADIGEFRELRSDPEGAAAYGAAVAAGEGALLACRTPTVAVVEGFAIGAGTQLAVACDLRVCGRSSRFAVPPAKLGIIYAQDSTARLVETVGAPWARWLLLTGDQLDAATALRVGLVHEVVQDAEVPAAGAALAASVAARAQVSLRGAALMVERAVAGRRDESDPEVQEAYAASLHGPEYAEGVAAFLEKRPPDFTAARRGARSGDAAP